MKVVCERAPLLEAVNIVAGVVSPRSPKPQLTCVKISATRDGDVGRLTLSATDADVWIRLSSASVDVHTVGEALAPAQKLQQIVAAEEHESVLTLETGENQLHISGQDAKFQIFGYPPGDFPAPPEFPKEPSQARALFGVSAEQLDHLISRTLFATARETSRYAINGVLLKAPAGAKRIEMVATDGRRLALARGQMAGGPLEQDVSCIIPSKALNLVAKLIGSVDEKVRVAITENQALFAFGPEDAEPDALIATTLVEGAFPPYEDVIPKDQDKKAVFDVAALRSGVRRAALLTNEESRGVRMTFGANADGPARLQLRSRAPEMGEAEVNVDVTSYDGEQIEIGFNPAFITDALKVVEDDQIVIELKAPNKPGLLKAGSDFLYVVMPVSLS